MAKLHPLIKGLLEHLPDPDTEWAASERETWIAAAVSVFDLLYPAPPEDSSPPRDAE